MHFGHYMQGKEILLSENIVCYHFFKSAFLVKISIYLYLFKSMSKVNWSLEDVEKLIFNVKPIFASS